MVEGRRRVVCVVVEGEGSSRCGSGRNRVELPAFT